ncbi:MAG: M15 family metallopeptidase [Aquincola sp.]|nr:M15 family metallopeptidase [Aquincola sp.]
MLLPRSENALRGVHPQLQAVVRLAAHAMQQRTDGLGFIVTQGLRTPQQQAELYRARATRTMDSRHLTGHAVDLAATVNGAVRWDWPLYPELAAVMKAAAANLGVTIYWGGDWTNFRDGPHFELNPRDYPMPAAAAAAVAAA